MAGELVNLITDAAIRNLADAGTYRRGQDYFTGGHVVSLAVRGARVDAIVSGSLQYCVMLTAAGGELDFSCGCPNGHGRRFL